MNVFEYYHEYKALSYRGYLLMNFLGGRLLKIIYTLEFSPVTTADGFQKLERLKTYPRQWDSHYINSTVWTTGIIKQPFLYVNGRLESDDHKILYIKSWFRTECKEIISEHTRPFTRFSNYECKCERECDEVVLVSNDTLKYIIQCNCCKEWSVVMYATIVTTPE